ncbi:MAG TPA: exodeoxyribonuclease V subunit gamma [Pseudomonadales bacterium]|nr:exodeoxyribonuclease V subunit gamma [Pseudomonadales bacterium]
MSLTVQFSNKVELLSEQLVAGMADPLADPLAPEYVLVDNIVMGQWLNLQLAQQLGIAANIRYIQPHELFWMLARAVVSADIPRETPLSKDEMTWKLYGMFCQHSFAAGGVLDDARLLPVKHYLQGEDSQPVKRYQLASAVADLFDQYLIYRPEWMLAWENPSVARKSTGMPDDSNAAWQACLWQKLAASSASTLSAAGLHHRASIEKLLLNTLSAEKLPAEKLQHTPSALDKKPLPLQRLFVFGITSMPPHLVDMLALLGLHIPVQVFALNPCREYWELIRSARSLAKPDIDEDAYFEIGNPLLASQGVQLREFINLLQEKADGIAGEQHYRTENDVAPANLLEAIQQEIRDLTYKGEPAGVEYVTSGTRQPLPASDGNTGAVIPSVHVHNCHSIMREVEVLHDQLRDIMLRNPDIHPRDIVVMMPRVAPYVPCIHAVFNSAPARARIDYQIADRTLAEESPLLNSVAMLLRLPESRLPLSEILSLLEVPAIQRRFSLGQREYETLKRWLVASGVRWGMDGQHRQSLGLPDYAEASWSFAFDRLLSGYAMAAEPTNPDALLACRGDRLVLPFDEIEGGNSHCLDALLQFWETLQHWRDRLQRPATAREWAARIRHLLDDFFDAQEEQELAAAATIYSAIRTLDNAADRQWFTGDMPLPVIRDLIRPVLQQTATGQHAWREGVKFCSLMPMRGVPFKVVYILGMNLEDYPRHVERRSFDLMRHHHRAGDRASRIDDRWLFLEALLSARQFFHVSYIGRDMHRNETREPSVVLSELLDYCRHGYALPDNYLVTEHPLQPFSDVYFRTQQDKETLQLSPRLLSFNREAWQVAAARQRQAGAVVDGNVRWQGHDSFEADTTVAVDDFIRFFTKPWDWFFARKHKVWLRLEEDNASDDENFGESNALDNWQAYNDLITMANARPDYPADSEAARDSLVAQLVQLRRAEGRWPLGKAGEATQQALQQTDAAYVWASQAAGIQLCALSVQTGEAPCHLTVTGEWPVTADKTFLVHSASKLGKDMQCSDKALDFVIRFALAVHAGAITEGKAIFRDKTLHWPVDAIDKTANKALLDLLASLYLRYQQTGLPFDFYLSQTLAALDDADERMTVIDSAWNERSEWKSSIASDTRKRSYFGNSSVLQGECFLAVSRDISAALAAWFAPVENYEAAQKSAAKAARSGSKQS